MDYIANSVNKVKLSQHAKVSLAWRWGIVLDTEDDVEFYSTHKPQDAHDGCIRVKGELLSQKITLIIDTRDNKVVTAYPKRNSLFSTNDAKTARDIFEKSIRMDGAPTLDKIVDYRERFKKSNGNLDNLILDFTSDQKDRVKSDSEIITYDHIQHNSLPFDRPSERENHTLAESNKRSFENLLPWIDGDELYYLNIPESEWPSIWRAESIDRLQEFGVKESHIKIIKAYYAQGEKTLVEKIYSMQAIDTGDSVANKPLKYFLVDLDPEQKRVMEKIKDDGPYLVKGSAGTGKSTIGLHRIKDLVLSRANESLFDEVSPKYGVITYTNVLVNANKAIFEEVIPKDLDIEIHHTTLDKIARDLAVRYAGEKSVLSIDGIENFIRKYVCSQLEGKHRSILDRLGYEYVAEEIEQIILGYNITNEDKYLKQKRIGRKRGLQRHEREAVWQVYIKFDSICQEKGATTFNMRRVMALRQLQQDPHWKRYSGLFVDEAQDLPEVARLLCLELVTDPKFLLFAADTAQSIYIVPPTWKETHKDFAKRRPLTLEKSYRSTEQISEAINPLRFDLDDDGDLPKNIIAARDGPKPHWLDVSANQHHDKISEIISNNIRRESNPINAGQIAIIVREKNRAQHFLKSLKSTGIPASIVDKSKPILLDGESVHIITAHSSKGLQFPIVIVPDVNDSFYPLMSSASGGRDELQKEELFENDQRLLYVALSRASSYLYMLVDPIAPSRYVEKLSRLDHWN